MSGGVQHAHAANARFTLSWDGRRLDVALNGESGPCDIAIDLDGCHFASSATNAHGVAQFDLPFSPSGNAAVAVLPRLGRGGRALQNGAAEICFGHDGARAGTRASQPLSPLIEAQRLLPYATDVMQSEVVVIVPVYDAPALVARCLDSVLRYSGAHARLIVIDDASPDAAVAPLLEGYRQHPHVEVLHNATNLGFTATVNRAMRLAAPADVILLNADAEVGPNWLTGLRRAAHSQPDIGTVTAVSDNAGAFSVPELEQANDLPNGWNLVATARALRQNAGLAYPSMPTGNGFCLYIRRAALDAVGPFDEAAFPQGYGEENDFCQRAQAAGFRDIIAGNVFVAHARSMSFGIERREALGVVGMRVLRDRWPNYDADVARALYSFDRRVLDWRVRRSYADANPDRPPRPRVLWLEDTGHKAPNVSEFEIWRAEQRGSSLCLFNSEGAQIPVDEPYESALHAALQMHAIELVASGKASIADTGNITQIAARLSVPILQVAGDDAAVSTRINAALTNAGQLQ